MHINYIELINVALALTLIFLAINKSVRGLLGLLFVYGSLYFLSSAIPLMTGASMAELTAMHRVGVGSGVLAKIATIVFLAIMFIFLFVRTRSHLWNDFKWQFYFIAAMVFVLLGYVINRRSGDWLQLQNVVGVEGMLAFAMLGCVGLRNEAPVWNLRINHLIVITVALAGSAVVAFYEVFSEKAWAGTVLRSGAEVMRVNRASSIFFNPNLYAFWSSLIFLCCAHGIYAYAKWRKWFFSGMSLAAIGLYFTGGRSASLLLLSVLFVCLLLIWRSNVAYRWTPLLIIPITFSVIYFFSLLIAYFGLGDQAGWRSVAILGERFAAAPLNVLQYALSKMSFHLPFHSAPEFLAVSPQVIESIEGRFVVEKSDSGFLTLLVDTGVFGLAAMLIFWAWLFLLVYKNIVNRTNPSSVYFGAILLYCFLAGFAMRFQVFPVWLLNGVCIAFCISGIVSKSGIYDPDEAGMFNGQTN